MVRTVAEDESEQKVLDDIAKFGWHCISIFAEGEEAEYSFTVGLFQSFGHPELIIFGLAPQVAHQILCIAADAARSGHPLDLAQPSDALVNNYLCCFTQVPASAYQAYVGFGRWYYGGNAFPLYQVVWPSREGLYPWHPQAAPEFRATQPVIAVGAGGA
ncbi:MAG: DUF4262 domain-containing protein [Rhodanobacter sp.]|uniref:DUF4262 domain-containing protein n=1 Tax=Rhodanobacter sp. PCA2 TaxID=2006117 RepID=UPI0015E6FF60|nr:DUF4262 domain-containing protein [Rhodanobacter sp. PCA2]MBA2079490.1 hypothetical protein [Rhodanobacter sp. PCA2]MBN8924398.1 DUF4262 domain-containing protein [Rhodanobacter sp.]